MARAASHYEIQQLRARYVLPAELRTPGVGVQILANGDWPYFATVMEVHRTRALVQYRRRTGGIKTKRLPFGEVYVKDALQQLRAERASAPGTVAQETS